MPGRQTQPVRYVSAFDIIGPVMVGPSSSHTAGAVRLGRLARQLLGGVPHIAKFYLMGSFAETYRGHGTDQALAAGILGFDTGDARIPHALDIASDAGLSVSFHKESGSFYHPNTVRIWARADQGTEMTVVGSSLGGGKIELCEIDAFPVHISGDRPTWVLWHWDRPGFLAAILGRLNDAGINVARLSLERDRRGGTALAAIEMDRPCHLRSWELMDVLGVPILQSRWLDAV